MMRINGKDYPTIVDAARELGRVSSKTVSEWIRKGIIPAPPILKQGTREIQVFPPDHIRKAKERLANHSGRKGKHEARPSG
jgi:hypothetical protein